jgi:hypothetical protein
MMDLGFEKDRNDLAVRAFQSKQEADKMKAEGMLGMASLIGRHTKDGRLADTAAQSEFWDTYSKVAGFIPYEAANQMFDNTYGAAAKAKETSRRLDIQQQGVDARAITANRRLDILERSASTAEISAEHRMAIADARLSFDQAKSERNEEYRGALLDIAEKKLKLAESGGTAQTKNDLYAAELEDRAKKIEASSPEEAKKLMERAAGVRSSGRLFDAKTKPTIAIITDDEGEFVKALIGPDGKVVKVLPKVDTSKLSQVEAILLKKEAERIDPDFYYKKEKDGNYSFDEVGFGAALKALEEKYTKKKPAAPGATTAPAGTTPASDPLGLFK